MPLDTSMYNQLLAPAKSVADYDQQAQQVQQNRLALQVGQQKADEYQRGIADAAHLRSVVSQFGADPAENVNKLYSAGRFAEAQTLAKSNAEVAAKNAETAGLTLDQQIKRKHDAMMEIAGFQTPQDVADSLQAHIDKGDIAPEHGKLLMASIPKTPEELPAWQMKATRQVLAPDKAIEYMAPTANTQLQSDTQVKTTGMNNDTSIKTAGISAGASKYSADSSARTAGARLAFDKSQAESNQDETMDPLAIRMTAQQYLAGDVSALSNFGRGAQGAKNLNAVRLEITKQANAAGLNGADIAAKVAEFGGLKAGQRTAGTRSANIEIAANEAAQLAPLALEASAKVARSSFVPFGKAQVMFDTNTNNPDMRQFAMANTALVNAYGQVMSRGGAATDSDKAHARELLATTFDQPSYAAAVAQLQAEIRAAQKAPQQVRKDLSNATSGRVENPVATPAGAKPSLKDIFGH